jgi:hypothetical protein
MPANKAGFKALGFDGALDPILIAIENKGGMDYPCLQNGCNHLYGWP